MNGLMILSTEQKGRGVACVQPIPKGSTIEICPVILLNTKDTQVIHKTHLHDYYFLWNKEAKTSALALGYGSLYNHHPKPNADYELLLDTHEIRFFSIRDIDVMEEITINYQSEILDEYPLWFNNNQD